MKGLLETKDIRKINIIEHLQFNPYLTGVELSILINCSIKTIQGDIKKINETLETVTIESVPGMGYELLISAGSSYEYVIDGIISRSPMFRLLHLILTQPGVTFSQLEQIENLSEKKIRQCMIHFNQMMAPSEMSILTNPLRLVGNESHITTLYMTILKGSFFNCLSISPEGFQFLNDLTLLLFKEDSRLQSTFRNNRNTLSLILYIRFLRESNGYSIPYAPTDKYFLFLEQKNCKENLQNFFNITLTNSQLNAAIEAALNSKISLNFLQSLYQLKPAGRFEPTHQVIFKSVERIMARFGYEIDDAELIDLLSPLPFSYNYRNINYEIHATIIAILQYEFKQLPNTEKRLAQSLFPECFLVELAHLLQIKSHLITSKTQQLIKQMKVGILVTNEHTKLVLTHYLAKLKPALEFTFIDYATGNYHFIITDQPDFSSDLPVILINNLPSSYDFQAIKNLCLNYPLTRYMEI
ncbi:MAG: helix-turn-helix domain-containing protein [Carnobacterium sp.]|uniref:helix-turn-helix domain-containing protein n=1 Tax=Carnobacterium sp. TaxID=48221 RepID=UPI002FC97B4D